MPGMRGALTLVTTRVRGMGLAVEAAVARLRQGRVRGRGNASDMPVPYRAGESGREPLMISQGFAAVPEQVRAAREFVRGLVGDGHPRADDILLVTSELAGNAVQHGSRGAGAGEEFVVSVTFTATAVVVAVRDGGLTGVPHVKAYDEDAIGGRGLALVESVSRRWGFQRDSAGTVVWAELDQGEGP